MERMRVELDVFGRPVEFIVVNRADAMTSEDRLVQRCAYPLFRDIIQVDAFDLHDAGKDDIYIYDADGRLAAHLPFRGKVDTNLSTPEGYRNLLSAILSVD